MLLEELVLLKQMLKYGSMTTSNDDIFAYLDTECFSDIYDCYFLDYSGQKFDALVKMGLIKYKKMDKQTFITFDNRMKNLLIYDNL